MASPPATQPLLPPGAVRQPQQNKRYGSTNPSSGQPQRQPTPTSGNRTKETPNPETVAPLYSRVTITWMNPIFKIGYRRQLQEEDIFEMAPQWKTKVLGEKLTVCWEDEKTKAKLKNRKPSLLRALVRFALPTYWLGIICLFVSDNVSRLVPFILGWIIAYLEGSQGDNNERPSSGQGYRLAVLLLITCMIQCLLAQVWASQCTRTGIILRTALVDLIFKKATVMSSKARLDYPDGTVFNLMSTDTSRVEGTCEGLLLLIAVPLATLITVVLLWHLIGPSALVGTFLLMTVNPVQAWAMTKLSPIREQASKWTDTRIRVATEILQGIRVIKFFTFEPSFLTRMSEVRFYELKYVSWLMQVRGFIYSTASSLPVFASALSFVLYGALGNKLEAKVIFPALALFTGLRIPLLVLPYCYSEALDAYVSVKRIEAFLLSQDTEPLPPIEPTHQYAITIKDADFYWDQLPSSSSSSSSTSDSRRASSEEQRPLLADTQETVSETAPTFLKDIHLDVTRGSLVAIVGPVGSGKSSLLQAIVGNMMKSRGDVVRGATISYASQTPWIQNATVRNNILFDTPLQEERYWKVVKACCLEHDLEHLKYGDQTEIGERGINLSGGQKARLSLARSVYYDAEVVVMDDPLSAVDAHVGRRLWEDCVLQELRSKTRVIATHQLHVLPTVDYVVCMKDGRIAEQGTFKSLMAKEGEFYHLMKQYGGHHDEDAEGRHHTMKRKVSDRKTVLAEQTSESDDDLTVAQEEEDTEEDEEETKNLVRQSQMTAEEIAFGAVSSQVYRSYFSLAGIWFWFIVIFLLFLQQAVGVAMTVWLTFWMNMRFDLSTWVYIDVYVGVGVVQMIIVMIGSYMLVMATIKSSKIMHDRAFVSVLNSPMAFFDTTPLGRILNRFSKDMDTIDSKIMGFISSFLITLTGIISVLILSAIFMPWMVVAIVPLMALYYGIAVFYQSTSRELKRLDSNLRSHLYSYFSETLSGMTTLKAYHQHGIHNAIERNQRNMDRSNKVYYLIVFGMRWIGIRIFTVGYLLNFAAVAMIVWTRDSISPATAGLVLSYLARLSSELNWAIQCYANVENNMNSAERLLHYTDSLEQEPPAEILDRKPAATWPSQGQISFRSVSMRYRDGLPLVLNNISFDIPAGGRVAVVGRTGAGKSSLIQALFRLCPLEEGTVVLDGIETDTIGTRDLRSKIAIIPQDPVLFQGTFRYNLDPLSCHTEQELWQVLETSDLKRYVQQQEGGLDAIVSTNGENLSVGQRQLLCLSRALLAKAKVVVLDEATASVDLATDSLIQKAIRVDFADSTVITIAHRLNTVIDYHRVLVMDQGQVAEYDTPHALLQDRSSAFSKMVDETGEGNAALLRSLAGR
ncbi:hypothetical protein EMPS_06665 [Entomortierella parvispora]|uniref:P-loop containing nucleoside triphosphate hydrolase protein n=1 Tax=Entomortierella parvispora TaxID=205924 RepID=A0A9P3HCW7_9FUNG|nr:hypothetical protein EMPS_06665 [Entomortierella parvispora]